MTENQSAAAAIATKGQMYLYERPELLTRADHGTLGLSAVERPFDFVKSAKVVPIAVSEIASAQKYYPIVFSDPDKPALLAVVSVFDDTNLFVDEKGNWDRSAYVPSYLHCHPFAFASMPNDQFAVIIDRAAASVSDSPELPFFDGENLTPQTQARVDFCGEFNGQRHQTSKFCGRLQELGLLSGQRAAQTPPGAEKEQEIASYVAVNTDKLKNLDKDTLQELHKNGSLSAIYAHIFSLENWHQLLERRRDRGLPVFDPK